MWTAIGDFFYGLTQDFLSIERLLMFSSLVFGYFCGLFQSAYILSKARHVDIYSKGSGNPGTTNMFRVMGVKFGILTFVLDIAKVVIAIFLTRFIFITWLHLPLDPVALKLYTGLGAVLGHNYPIYLRFKGGKGVAATCAVYICLGDWRLILIGLCVFILIFLITRYVSLASMTVCIVCLFTFLIGSLAGWIKVDPAWLLDCQIIMILFAVLVLVTHRQNIIRLVYGEESKFYFKKKKPAAAVPDTDSAKSEPVDYSGEGVAEAETNSEETSSEQ